MHMPKWRGVIGEDGEKGQGLPYVLIVTAVLLILLMAMIDVMKNEGR